jgi:hypothetical protein
MKLWVDIDDSYDGRILSFFRRKMNGTLLMLTSSIFNSTISYLSIEIDFHSGDAGLETLK